MTYIVLGKKNPVEVELKPTQVCGWFKLEAVKLSPGGIELGRRTVADWFPNLITDNGLNLMGDSTYLDVCAVGSGSGTPAVTDTALDALIAATGNQQSFVVGTSGPPYYGWSRKVFRFSVGAAAGNLSEVGVGLISTSLYSRALILDGGGSPTTITVLSDEALDVTYEHRVYSPVDDVLGNTTIGGVNYAWTLRTSKATNHASLTAGSTPNRPGWGIPANFLGDLDGSSADGSENSQSWWNVFTGPIGTVTQIPSGTASSYVAGTFGSYSNNSLLCTVSRSWALTEGNLSGGVKSVLFSSCWCCYQMEFGANIPKDGTNVLELTAQHSWTRYTP